MLDLIRKFLVAAVVVPLSMLGGARPVIAQQISIEPCGPLTSSFGPYDYRTADAKTKEMVESFHFTPAVEALIRGQSGSIGGDLHYTLSVFPNHHRALVAMANLGAKLKSSIVPGAKYSVDCYFIRALRFRHDDPIVHMIFARHLAATGRRAEALKQLEAAAEIDPANGFTQYNVGLIYLEMSEWDSALKQAHAAAALGFIRPELKDRLVASHHWREPISGASSSASGASAPVPR